MPKIKIFYIVAIFFVGLSCAGLYYAYTEHQKEQAAIQAELEAEKLRLEEEAKELARQKKQAELDRLFETYLTDFKNDIKAKAVEYKNNRRVLKEILSPDNYMTVDYAKENYTLFVDNVAPNLRQQSNDIVNVFQSYSEKLEEDLKDKETEVQAAFLEKWQEMIQEQLEHYIDFFAKEELTLRAYEDLLRFYYTHSNFYTIDVEKNEFIFEREQDRETERDLLTAIAELKSEK